MTLDQLIADLTAIRAANPALGSTPVLMESDTSVSTLLGYVAGIDKDGNGPVAPEGPEAATLYLAPAPEMR